MHNNIAKFLDYDCDVMLSIDIKSKFL